MHATIKKLESLITQDQLNSIKAVLKEDYTLLESALSSSSDEEARSAVEAFAAALSKRPLRALKLNRLLTKEQKSIVMGLIPDDDDEDEDV